MDLFLPAVVALDWWIIPSLSSCILCDTGPASTGSSKRRYLAVGRRATDGCEMIELDNSNPHRPNVEARAAGRPYRAARNGGAIPPPIS